MTKNERSVRWEGRPPRPTWWLLYLIAALVVAVVGLVQCCVDAAGLRKILESLSVIGGFGLVALWRRENRIALDLERRRHP